MNSKHIFTLFLLVIASLVVSCQAPVLDNEPAGKEGWVTVPYSLKVGKPADTKVDYSATEGYSFNAGDKISISGVSRSDISGTLTLSSGNLYEGDLTYDTAEGSLDGASLKATLVHAANDVQATYAHAIVPIQVSGTPTDEAIAAALASALDEAAEKYTLFSVEYTYGETAVSLVQNAAFLNIEVGFTGYLFPDNLPSGETPVEVSFSRGVSNETVSGNAVLVIESDVCKARFLAVVPGEGTTLVKEESKVTICDRDIVFLGSTKDNKALENNKLYTVEPREVSLAPKLLDPYWSDGTYGRIAHDPGVEVTGIIVYVNDGTAFGNAITEKEGSDYGHALVMSIKNANSKDANNKDIGQKWGAKGTLICSPAITSTSQTLADANVNGFANTTTIASAQGANSAAYMAKNYRTADTYTNTTGWFLPTIGQWLYSIVQFGDTNPTDGWLWCDKSKNTKGLWFDNGQLNYLAYVKSGDTNENLLVTALNNRLEVLSQDYGCSYDSFGMTSGSDFADNYWTCSEYDKDNALRLNFGSVETHPDYPGKYWSTIKADKRDKASTYAWKEAFIMKVRPFLAF